jgi:uncharacterized membrane protein (UPF0127 family)
MRVGYIAIAEKIYETFFAISSSERQKGLMDIDPPAPVMSFVNLNPQINKFWMHRTKMALDIIFCYNGEVSELCYGEPNSLKLIGSEKLSNIVIEMPYGTAKKNGIKIGDAVTIIKPGPLEMKKICSEECWK